MIALVHSRKIIWGSVILEVRMVNLVIRMSCLGSFFLSEGFRGISEQFRARSLQLEVRTLALKVENFS